MTASNIEPDMSPIPDHIIIKFLQNSASMEEKQLMNTWLYENEQNMTLFCQLMEIWDSGKQMPEEEIKRRWEQFYQKIEHDPVASTPVESTKPGMSAPGKKRRIGQWTRYAAALLAGIVIASVWYSLHQDKDGGEKTIIQNVVFNQKGVQKLLLPDSSVVYLSGNSRITYPERFDARQRQVSLEGEAFFDVRKNPALPFEVKAGNAAVCVTGTEFVVEASPEHNIVVTLVSGSVSVNVHNEAGARVSEVHLTPGQQAGIDSHSGQASVKETDTYYYVAWKDGTYRFTDEPLEKIIGQVARRYHVKVHITPALKGKRFTGRITPEHDITEVMDIIKVSHPVKYRVTATDVYISEK